MSDTNTLKTIIQINGGEDPLSSDLKPRELYIKQDGYLYVNPNVNEQGQSGITKIKAGLADNAILADRATKLLTQTNIKTDLSSTSSASFFGNENEVITPGVQGTLSIGNGGTGLTSNPSRLVNLSSSAAASVFASSPRPGVTGILNVANGGTGCDQFTAGAALIGAGTNGITTRAITNKTTIGNAGWTSSIGTNLITLNTLAYWNGQYANGASNLTKLGVVDSGTWSSNIELKNASYMKAKSSDSKLHTLIGISSNNNILIGDAYASANYGSNGGNINIRPGHNAKINLYYQNGSGDNTTTSTVIAHTDEDGFYANTVHPKYIKLQSNKSTWSYTITNRPTTASKGQLFFNVSGDGTGKGWKEVTGIYIYDT